MPRFLALKLQPEGHHHICSFKRLLYPSGDLDICEGMFLGAAGFGDETTHEITRALVMDPMR